MEVTTLALWTLLTAAPATAPPPRTGPPVPGTISAAIARVPVSPEFATPRRDARAQSGTKSRGKMSPDQKVAVILVGITAGCYAGAYLGETAVENGWAIGAPIGAVVGALFGWAISGS